MMAKPEESQKYAIGAKQLYTLWSAFAVPMEMLAELIFRKTTERGHGKEMCIRAARRDGTVAEVRHNERGYEVKMRMSTNRPFRLYIVLQRNHAARGVLLCPRGWANVDASSRRTDHESTGSDLRPERLSLDFGHGSELARRLALE
jgi:hypothetical protein